MHICTFTSAVQNCDCGYFSKCGSGSVKLKVWLRCCDSAVSWALFQWESLNLKTALLFIISFIGMTSSCLLLPCLSVSSFVIITLLLPHTGQRSSPGGVSHQKETGLSSEGVSDRRQGRHRQFQHTRSAPGYAPGPSEKPATGTTPEAMCSAAYGAE